MLEFWEPTTSEVNDWGVSNSGGQLGKPGRYEDPALFAKPSAAFTQYYAPLRMTQDANAAKVASVANPQEPQGHGFTGLLNSLATITDQLVKNVDRTWRDPDTGTVHFGTGETMGRKFAETQNLGERWLSQARGFFTAGLPADREPIPAPAAPGVGRPQAAGGVGLLVVALLILWGVSK